LEQAFKLTATISKAMICFMLQIWENIFVTVQ
jgi:hypothetical protein